MHTEKMSAPYKVLLINPPPWKVVEPWYDTPNFPRQALAYLAAYLRQHEGFEIRIIDAKLERISFDEVIRRALEFKPDVVGLTAFTNEIKPAAYVAARFKKERPNVTTVIGGVHLTAMPALTLREFPSFDIGCVGEGEVTFYELCQAVQEGTPLGTVRGIVYRNGEEVLRTPTRPQILDQNTIPFPAYDLFPQATEYWIMTQRGCPFRCQFCFNPNGRAPRQRTIENTISEVLMILDEYQPDMLWFADEIFSVDMERAHHLLDAMIEIDVPKRTKFWIESHVNFVDYDLFKHLKEAGCYQCGLGVETGDEEKFHTLGKGTNVEMAKEAFVAARRAKLKVLSFFIIGQPNETVHSIKKTINLAVELNPHTPIFGTMVPYPGTEVARLAAKGEAGYRLITTDWDEFNKQIGGALEFAGLSRWQIEWFQFSGYLKIFLCNWRFIALIRFMWTYRVAGFKLFFKILRGLFKDRLRNAAGDREVPTTDELREIADATDAWLKTQVQNLQYAKKYGDPETMKVVHKNKFRIGYARPVKDRAPQHL